MNGGPALAQKSPEEAKKLSRYAEPLPDREYSSQAELLAAEKEVGRELVAALKQHKEDPALKEELALYERVLNGEGVGSVKRSLKKSGFRSSPRSTTAGKESLHAEIENKTTKDGGIFSCLGKMTVS